MHKQGAILGFLPAIEAPINAKALGDQGLRTSLGTLNSLMLRRELVLGPKVS